MRLCGSWRQMNNTIKNIHKNISRKLRSYVENLFFMLSPQVFRSLLSCTNCFYKHSTVLFHTITSCCRDFSKYADFFLREIHLRNQVFEKKYQSSGHCLFDFERFEHFSTRCDLFSIRQWSQNYVHRFLNPDNPEAGEKRNWSSGKSMTHVPFVETVFLICCLVVHCTPRRLPQNW